MKLLRIEGVNLAHCVEDSEDLSTRRGGSLMLLEAVNQIDEAHGVRGTAQLQPISTGASTGLFEIVGGDEQHLLADIGKRLAAPPYKYGTFVVDVVAGSDFHQVEIAAIAANRWGQMQSLSFSAEGLTPSTEGVCKVDEVRPARQTDTVKGRADTPVSESVKARRSHGVKARQGFYRKLLVETNHFDELQFCNDFEEIAVATPDLKLDPAILDGKLAVFYADGNQFGKIAGGRKDPDDLNKWDSYLKGQRKGLLSGLLEIAKKHPRWQTQDKKLRLETLLWGGDELMFVVPGWCGMELAQRFFEHTKNLSYPENSGKTLTHACGLVFCHHQAPISRISELAKKLAEEGKKASRAADSLNWLVLESFDHVGGDLDEYLNRRFKPAPGWNELALNRDALDALVKHLPALKQNLPRSALVQITRAYAEGRAFVSKGELAPLIKRARQQVAKANDEGAEDFKLLWKALHPEQRGWEPDSADPDDLGAWVKLAELWDYCPDRNNGAAS